MKVNEITVSLSGVIAVASYENLRPGYQMTVELSPQDDPYKVMLQCQDELHKMMDAEAIRGKTDYLKRAYEDKFRWYQKDGRDYISVTTVLYWDAEWHVTPDHLAQLASRGTVVGEIVETYLKDKIWIDPEKTASLADDVNILKTGSSGLSWEDCSYRAFCEKYAEDITVENTQGAVFNDEHKYAGTYDIVGTYKRRRAVIDVKCGGHNMAQLAAYAACLPGIEVLVVLPVGPTDNKCGYQQPKVCEDIQGEFQKFLQARAKFRQRFSV